MTSKQSLHLPKLRIPFRNGYFISASLHLVLIVFAAFWYLKPHLENTWHQFEWEMPPHLAGSHSPKSIGIPHDNSQDSNGTRDNDGSSQASSKSDLAIPHIPSPLEQPLDTTPATTSSTGLTLPYNNNQGRISLRNVGNGLPNGNQGFSAELENGDGDAYVIYQPKPNIIPDDEGEVVLEFSLSANGGVNINSVNVVTFTSAKYLDSVRKVLPTWKFGFRKSYNPNKTYRIRCRFTIND